MSAEDRYERLATKSIQVAKERQRTELGLDDAFVASIAQRGILCPLLVTHERTLVAGGRRYAAAVQLGMADVPVRYVRADLTENELRVIELEENVRRSALPWRDECRAVEMLHRHWSEQDAEWTQAKTEAQIGHDVGKWLRVARELDNPRLSQANSFWSAYNICQRIDARAADAVLEDISFAGEELFESATDADVGATSAQGSTEESGEPYAPSGSPPGARAPSTVPGEARDNASPTLASPLTSTHPTARSSSGTAQDILCGDFKAWASTYSGPRFNFVHCDFPYGKKVFSGQWGGKSDSGFQYDDSPDVYWELIETLCAHRERLCTPTAHLMFWLSSEVEMQHETIARFRSLAPDFIFQARALVWLKSDNVGIVPDPKRGPRWITELALMATRGDRTLVRPLANAYAAPTARHLHPSTKPEPVLRHFFGMFVDATTRLLDPTCGSGSALRAAESLGAQQVFGIERDSEFAAAARKALKDFRTLRDFVA